MQIIYPYQVRRIQPPRRARMTGRRLSGLGAFCDFTPGCDCKETVTPLFDDINRIRNEIGAVMGQYGSLVPQYLKDRLAEQEKQYLIVYNSFIRADERCYGNWRGKIAAAPADYQEILQLINAALTQQASSINAGGAGSGAGAGSGYAMPEFISTSSPIIPGTSAGLNPWLIAGAVGVALFIGYKLMTKVQ